MTSGPRRVLLVTATTGYQTEQFVRAAESLGIELLLASDRCHVMDDPWGDRAIPVQFDQTEQSMLSVSLSLQSRPVQGILGLADRPSLLAAYLAQELQLPFHTAPGMRAAHSKFMMRAQFETAGLLVPEYRQILFSHSPKQWADRVTYPCVLKPMGLSASRGVIRANNPDEFNAAFERIRRIINQPELAGRPEEQDRYLVAEDYIPGREFAIEAVVTHGELTVLAIFDKPEPLEGPYFEETIYVTPSEQPLSVQQEFTAVLQKAVIALGLTHGPIHAELRYNEQGVWMLEAAGRPIGGLCSQSLRFTGGESLESLLLRHALGEDVRPARLADPATGVMMIPIPKGGTYQGVSGEAQAAAVEGIWQVAITAKVGQRLLPLPEGASYLGFLFARGDTPEAVRTSLQNAHQQLSFDIATQLPVLR